MTISGQSLLRHVYDGEKIDVLRVQSWTTFPKPTIEHCIRHRDVGSKLEIQTLPYDLTILACNRREHYRQKKNIGINNYEVLIKTVIIPSAYLSTSLYCDRWQLIL